MGKTASMPFDRMDYMNTILISTKTSSTSSPSMNRIDMFRRRKAFSRKSLPAMALGLLLATGLQAAETPQSEEGFVSLFDGKTLDGWKVGENASVFQVRDGMIVMECPKTIHSPAHLFYVGNVNGHSFKNFDLRIEVMTFPCANSGIYFHTEYQEAGWPKRGLECQVNNSHSDWRRTGSLYAIKNISWGPGTPSANNICSAGAGFGVFPIFLMSGITPTVIETSRSSTNGYSLPAYWSRTGVSPPSRLFF